MMTTIETRRQRRSKGLCSECNHKALGTKSLCKIHLLRHNRSMIQAVRTRIIGGQCRVIGCPLAQLPGYVRCEVHRVIENVQARDRKRKHMHTTTQAEPLSLDHAQFMILGGKKFGEIYPRVDPKDRLELKNWYVYEHLVPVHKIDKPGKPTSSPTQAIMDSREMGYTGEYCSACGSYRMKRNGACAVCEDCGTQGGCG